MKKNTSLFIALIVSVCLSLSACGGSGSSSGGETDAESSLHIETADTGESSEADSEDNSEADSKDNSEGDSEAESEETEEQTSSDETGSSADDFDIEKKLASMTVEEKVAQMFCPSLDSFTEVTGSVVPGEITKSAYYNCPTGGIDLSSDNISTPEQLKALTDGLQAFSEDRIGLPLIIVTTEEGGRVARVAINEEFDVPRVGPMMDIGDTGDAEKAYEAGQVLGTYLSEYGFNVDFAPVADVLTNDENTVIGDRAFSSDPQVVAEMSDRCSKGMEEAGVIACLKHFPGHGGTSEDSHSGMAVNYDTKEELWACDLIPFEYGIEHGTKMIMSGHISLPNITGNDVPSSLSYEILTGLLREEMGFEGIIISDALNMGAISEYYSPGEAAVLAVKAGNDMLLPMADFQEMYDAVVDAVKSGEISEERIDESVRRILELKQEL